MRDKVFTMPRIPTPNAEQGTVNRELIDATRALWIQIRNLRVAADEQQRALEEIERKIGGSSGAEDQAVPPRWKDANTAGVSLGTAASAPDSIAWRGGNILVRAYDGLAITESLYGAIEIPHNFFRGSNFVPHIHWAPTDANAGNVYWQLTYEVIRRGVGAVITSGTTGVVSPSPGVAWQSKRASFPQVDGTDVRFGDQFGFRLFRDPGNVNDTYGSDAAIAFTFGIHYLGKGDGSRTINIR